MPSSIITINIDASHFVKRICVYVRVYLPIIPSRISTLSGSLLLASRNAFVAL